MILEILSFSFMQRAFLAASLFSLVAPLVGFLVVARRQALIADTLSHAAFAGVALSGLFALPAYVGSTLATVFAGLSLEVLRKTRRLPGEAALALVLSASLAIALVVFSMTRGIGSFALGYLFGSVTTVSWAEVLSALAIALVIGVFFISQFSRLSLLAYDEDVAEAQGVSTTVLNVLLTLCVAALVVIGMRVVGVLLVGAFLVVPILAASKLKLSLRSTLVVATTVSLLASWIGLFASYAFNLAAGGTIVLLLVLFYFAASAAAWARK